MTRSKIYAQAWAKVAEIVNDAAMDEYEDDEDVIDAIYRIVDERGPVMDQAKICANTDEELRRIHSNLKTPEREAMVGLSHKQELDNGKH